jgi:DNA-binding phage protein
LIKSLIAFVKSEEQSNIKIKIAISLKQLLSSNKRYIAENDLTTFSKSYNKIALSADLRKATVSDIFNAKSNCQITSLFPIIEAMGYNLSDFSEIYDNITETNVMKFIA